VAERVEEVVLEIVVVEDLAELSVLVLEFLRD